MSLVIGGMSAGSVGRHLRISSKRVFRVIQRHSSHALATQQINIVKHLSVDETSTKIGLNYFTILADSKAKKVVGLAVGKDADTFAHPLVDMEVRGADW